MIELLVFLLWAIGIVYFFTESTIMSPVRRLVARGVFLQSLVYCASCTGFWIGVLLYYLGHAPDALHYVEDTHHNAAITGCVVMAVANMWSTYKGGNPAYDFEVPKTKITTTTTYRDVE